MFIFYFRLNYTFFLLSYLKLYFSSFLLILRHDFEPFFTYLSQEIFFIRWYYIKIYLQFYTNYEIEIQLMLKKINFLKGVNNNPTNWKRELILSIFPLFIKLTLHTFNNVS